MTIFSKSPFFGNKKVSDCLLNGNAKDQFASGKIPFFRADFKHTSNRIEQNADTKKLMDQLNQKLKGK